MIIHILVIKSQEKFHYTQTLKFQRFNYCKKMYFFITHYMEQSLCIKLEKNTRKPP